MRKAYHRSAENGIVPEKTISTAAPPSEAEAAAEDVEQAVAPPSEAEAAAEGVEQAVASPAEAEAAAEGVEQAVAPPAEAEAAAEGAEQAVAPPAEAEAAAEGVEQAVAPPAEAEAAAEDGETTVSPRPPQKGTLSGTLRILRKFLIKLGIMLVYAALFAGVIFGVIRHYKSDTAIYEKTYYAIQTDQLESNIRIVLLSDLHLNQFGENNDTLVKDIAQFTPDLIAIVGDMNCQDNPDVSVVLSLCERLTKIAPTYYSYGNHEVAAIELYGDTLQKELEDRGVIVVNNRISRATINGNPVAICGLTYDSESYKEAGYIKKIMERFLNIDDAYTILLAHYPDLFCEDGALYYSGINLALCGHAHGGQVRIPLVGGLYSNGQGFLPDLTEGVHGIYGGGKVVISRGLGDGNDKPPRINNPYELVVLDVNWY